MAYLTHTLLFFILVDFSEGPKNVLQVTWQKILAGGTEDVGSYNKRFGTKINPPFQGKVEFEHTGLQNSTIVVRNVTKADQGCLRCLFNAYPEGAIYTKTCLIVDVTGAYLLLGYGQGAFCVDARITLTGFFPPKEEQPEPILHVTQPTGTELMVVSCSAVSRPALTVTLEVPTHLGSSNYSTVHSVNTDGTITVTSTVTLQRFCNNGTQIHCVVTLSSGLVKDVSRVVYSDKQDVCEKCEAEQSGCNILVICAAAVTGVGVIICMAVGLVLRFRKKGTRSNNDSVMKQMRQTMIQETKEPLVSHTITR